MYKPSSLPYILIAIVFLIVAISAVPSGKNNSTSKSEATRPPVDEAVTNQHVEATKRPVTYDSAPLTPDIDEDTLLPDTDVLDYPIVEYGSDGIAYAIDTDRNGVIVTGIGSCTDTHIVIPSVYKHYRVLEIGAGAFQGNKSIVSVTIADGVTSIGENAFNGCGKLVEVVLPTYTLKTINASAFANCVNLSKINIPQSVSYIGELTFSRCKMLFDLNYESTSDDWARVDKHPNWSKGSSLSAVYCTDTSVYVEG
jgi:hypothetical protein